jgi:hypothetical protein
MKNHASYFFAASVTGIVVMAPSAFAEGAMKYSYEEAQKASENGVVFYYGSNVEKPEWTVETIAESDCVSSIALPGNANADAVATFVVGRLVKEYENGQSALNRARVAADASRQLGKIIGSSPKYAEIISPKCEKARAIEVSYSDGIDPGHTAHMVEYLNENGCVAVADDDGVIGSYGIRWWGKSKFFESMRDALNYAKGRCKFYRP